MSICKNYYDTGSDQPYCGNCGQHVAAHSKAAILGGDNFLMNPFPTPAERFGEHVMDPANDPERRWGNQRLVTREEIERQLTAALAERTDKAMMRSASFPHPLGGGPTRATILPEEGAERKKYPIASGVLDYFPDAIAYLAHLSWKANEQHNPGQPVHWARGKSIDHADTSMRHFLQRGTLDTDGIRHTGKAAWRLLAMLQEELEAAQEKGEAA